MTSDEHLYIVIYDIRDDKRLRTVFKTMQGFGEWVQLSAFQCRLTAVQAEEMLATLDEIIHHDEDHVLVADVGPAHGAKGRISTLGQRGFDMIELTPVIV